MDEMLEYIDKDGIVQVRLHSNHSRTSCQSPRQTYFDHRRLRFDPVVCVNVLTFFYANGRGHELPETFAWVKEVLINRGYTDGTRYYATPECFLFFMARLLERVKDTEADLSLRPIFSRCVQERIGSEGDALALAMRVLACASVGIRDEMDLRTLLNLQQEDGGWEAGWMYKYGSSGINIGNRGLTTALAINAIEALDHLPKTPLYGLRLFGYQISIVSPDSSIVEFEHAPRSCADAEGILRHRWGSSARKEVHWPWVDIIQGSSLFSLFI